MDKLTIVSADSHATVPPELWAEYLDPRFHDLLPQLRRENEVFPAAMWALSSFALTAPGLNDEHHADGATAGVHDAGVRIGQMDREGVAAELIYHGDHRTSDLFHNVSNDRYSLEAWDAGAHAYDRWAADAFGADTERFLLVGAIGPCIDIDAAVAEINWIADHGFVGTYAPGYMKHPDMPPLSDPHWEPLWAACAARGIALVVHAGYGFGQGEVYPRVEHVCSAARADGETEEELARRLVTDVFGNVFTDIKARRAMWQLMMGGAFDRHPDLRLLMSEVRLDWVPALLDHLDGAFDEQRADLPALRKPSEYWATNCLAGASFVHKAEVEMRHEIGVETIAFGRDYPHPEGTWPHTGDWLRDAFAGVPEAELRLMLGENLIGFLGLDSAALTKVAARIGPTVDDIARGTAPAELVASFDLRGGYLKPAEGGEKLPEMAGMLRDDLAHLTSGAAR
jgi:predicted TIM-barrel fold metal-dependent hydrolase